MIVLLYTFGLEMTLLLFLLISSSLYLKYPAFAALLALFALLGKVILDIYNL